MNMCEANSKPKYSPDSMKIVSVSIQIISFEHFHPEANTYSTVSVENSSLCWCDFKAKLADHFTLYTPLEETVCVRYFVIFFITFF